MEAGARVAAVQNAAHQNAAWRRPCALMLHRIYLSSGTVCSFGGPNVLCSIRQQQYWHVEAVGHCMELLGELAWRVVVARAALHFRGLRSACGSGAHGRGGRGVAATHPSSHVCMRCYSTVPTRASPCTVRRLSFTLSRVEATWTRLLPMHVSGPLS